MFDIDMDEELKNFYKDKNRFKYLKKIIDFNFEDKEFKSKGIKINPPKFKKKLTTSKFIKSKRKGLF